MSRYPTFVCRKKDNDSLMKCICGRCEAEKLKLELEAAKASQLASERECVKLRATLKRIANMPCCRRPNGIYLSPLGECKACEAAGRLEELAQSDPPKAPSQKESGTP